MIMYKIEYFPFYTFIYKCISLYTYFFIDQCISGLTITTNWNPLIPKIKQNKWSYLIEVSSCIKKIFDVLIISSWEIS